MGLQTLRQRLGELCVGLQARFGLGQWLMKQRYIQFYVKGHQAYRQPFLVIRVHK